MVEFSEIQQFVKAHYQLEINQVVMVTRKLFKIVTENHDYLLKFAYGNDEFIMKQLFAHKSLPQNVMPIYRTKNQEHHVKLEEGQFAYLTDYVQVIPLPLEKQIHYYVELLEKLHRETRIVVDMSEEEVTRLHDDEYRTLQENYATLQRNMEEFELRRDRSPYEWYFMMLYPMLYTMLNQANDELKKFHDLLKRKKKVPVSLIHGDVNVANVLVSEKATHLINFEKSDFAMEALDRCAFLNHYHQVPGIQQTMLDYVKNEKEKLLLHYFFFKSLCVDLKLLGESEPNSLMRISLLNEVVAPHLLALQIYEEYHKPPPKKEPDNPLKSIMKK